MHWYRLAQKGLPYGYWLSPEGDLILVSTFGHARKAREILGVESEDQIEGFDNSYAALWAKGWIRMVCQPFFGMVWTQNPTYSQIKVIKELAEDYFIKDNNNINNITINNAGPRNLREFNEMLNGRMPTITSFDFSKFYKQANIPPTQYGYWLSTSGEFVPVENHVKHAKELLKNNPLSDFENYGVYGTMFREGWIRLVAYGNGPTFIEFRNKPTPSQKMAIMKLLEERNQIDGSFVKDIVINNFRPTSLREVNESLYRESKSLKNIKQAAGLPYGYWLAPDGTLLPVDYQNHQGVAIKALGYANSEDYFNKNRTGRPYDELFAKGYIRLITSDNFDIQIDMLEPTNAQVKTLLELAEDYYVDNKRIINNISVEKNRDWDSPNNWNQFYQMLTGSVTGENWKQRYASQASTVKQATSSSYGYWVSPQGEAVPVSDHYTGAEKIIENNKKDFNNIGNLGKFDGIYNTMFGNHWVRMVTTNGSDIEFYHPLTGPQKKTILGILEDKGVLNSNLITNVTINNSVPKNIRELNESLNATSQSHNTIKQAGRPYGYWLSPIGELVEVSFNEEHEGHWGVGLKILGASSDEELLEMYGGDGNPYEILFRMGWVRLVTEYEMGVEFTTPPTSQQKKIIIELAEDYGFLQGRSLTRVFVNNKRQINTLLELNQALNKTASKAKTATLNKTADDVYGYWISPKGETVEVPPYGHFQIGANILGFKDPLQVPYNKDVYSELYSQGWVRMVTRGMAFVQFKQPPTGPQRQTILGILEDRNFLDNFLDKVVINEQKPNNIRNLNQMLLGALVASTFYELKI